MPAMEDKEMAEIKIESENILPLAQYTFKTLDSYHKRFALVKTSEDHEEIIPRTVDAKTFKLYDHTYFDNLIYYPIKDVLTSA